jgi:hypothetical protein
VIPVNGISHCGPELSHVLDPSEHCTTKVPHTLLATLVFRGWSVGVVAGFMADVEVLH